MKILRLTNSSDIHPGVTPEQRSPAVCERVISEALGEPVETVVKTMWPTPAFSGVLGRWLEQYEPDVVFIRLSSFWVAYESVPLRIQRKLGRAGTPIAAAGLRLGDRPWLVERGVYKGGRKLVVRTIGGDTHFTPAEVGAVFDAVFRNIAAKESILPVVRGTNLLLNSAGTKSGMQRTKQRVAALNHETEAACIRHHVTFFPEPPAEALSDSRLGDELHDSPEAHERLGIDDANAILEAWRAWKGP
ncbi:MAG: SGNH/GDSL hydrolase family protein [Dehalococcoidia bacterium]